MKIITSKENPTYKNALRLKRKKYRDETGSYLLEGVKPLEDALDMGIKAMKADSRSDGWRGSIQSC